MRWLIEKKREKLDKIIDVMDDRINLLKQGIKDATDINEDLAVDAKNAELMGDLENAALCRDLILANQKSTIAALKQYMMLVKQNRNTAKNNVIIADTTYNLRGLLNFSRAISDAKMYRKNNERLIDEAKKAQRKMIANNRDITKLGDVYKNRYTDEDRRSLDDYIDNVCKRKGMIPREVATNIVGQGVANVQPHNVGYGVPNMNSANLGSDNFGVNPTMNNANLGGNFGGLDSLDNDAFGGQNGNNYGFGGWNGN